MIVPYEVVLAMVVVAGKSDDARSSDAQGVHMSGFEEHSPPGAEAHTRRTHPEADSEYCTHRRTADTVFGAHYLQQYVTISSQNTKHFSREKTIALHTYIIERQSVPLDNAVSRLTLHP